MHGGTEKGATFASLAYPEYRRLWISGLIVFMAVNAQGIARGWLAREITGTRWSGPVFFGLKKVSRTRASVDA